MKFSSFNLLEELNRPAFTKLREKFTSRSHDQGTIIYGPQEEADQVFVVATGRIRVFLSYGNKEFTLAILLPGQVYTTHTRAFVQAMDECKLLTMETSTFHASLSEYPELAGSVMSVLGGLLKNSFSIISGLVFKDANRRLVEHLLDEANGPAGGPADGPADGPVTIKLGLTTEQLAQIVGTTRQTVSMLLSDLVRNGDLEKLGRGTYRISAPKRLQALIDND